ncbi:hypothetical protein [Streptomyces sp. NPDC051909]|uniref:hypothetical protein n=1 Tax=Streptomyces sp. NPDC051909 TaxID=3154944 RepID=UPI00344A911C
MITTLLGGRPGGLLTSRTGILAAGAPNRRRAADLTHMKTRAGAVHVAFAGDTVSRRIAGWSAATVKESVLALDARRDGGLASTPYSRDS